MARPSPTLRQVLASAARLQEVVPDAVLVGDSAAALQAGHRDSFDHDPVLADLVDRGLVADWKPVFAEIRRSPWGSVARRVERYLSYRERDGIGVLFALAIEHARARADESDRADVAAQIRAAVERSGLTNAQFAELVGTSASRLSTYLSGKVTPSAALLLRMERVASRSRLPGRSRRGTGWK